jgi:hypothetical protein
MEETYSSETSVDFHRTTRRHIREYSTFHNHRCENLKSCMVSYVHRRFQVLARRQAVFTEELDFMWKHVVVA